MSTKDEHIVKLESQVTKVEGYVDERTMPDNPRFNGTYLWLDQGSGKYPHRPALLLIAPEGSTQVPRVWTEEEVRAMVKMVKMLKEAHAAIASLPFDAFGMAGGEGSAGTYQYPVRDALLADISLVINENEIDPTL